MTEMMLQTMSSHPASEGGKRLNLNDRLGLISLIEEGLRLGSSDSPIMEDLFNDLWDLVSATASGSRIDRHKPEATHNGFRRIEVNAETGENLGRLNMLYLKKPMPCYYLVYVEVAAPFRRKGLGHRILKYFTEFLAEKSAVGILDNIIPKEDPTYDIYYKHAWEPVEAVTGPGNSDGGDNYMIYVPPRLNNRDLKQPLLRVLHHLKRKRAAIDMRENEMMVQRTISEFKDLYSALLTYFDADIKEGQMTPIMRFMFTRFVTKFVAFRRRIRDLLGYTGGESLEQISLAPEIAALPLQSYIPRDLATETCSVTGEQALWARLPEDLKRRPAQVIESLPNYRRPSLVAWFDGQGGDADRRLTIGDLMDLGFDPTRLKEMPLEGDAYIFERIQAKQLPELERKKDLLEHLAPNITGIKVRGAQLLVNPPLLTIQDRGNAYVLRRKVSGIHWDEAVEQLQGSPSLKGLNAAMKFDRLTLGTVQAARAMIEERFSVKKEDALDLLTYFVSWDLKTNRPKMMVDPSGTFLESVWLA